MADDQTALSPARRVYLIALKRLRDAAMPTHFCETVAKEIADRVEQRVLKTDHSALNLDCRWYRFDDAPVGSYACLHSPDGEMQSATLSWMPGARGQIPQHARTGYVCPIPELKSAIKTMAAA